MEQERVVEPIVTQDIKLANQNNDIIIEQKNKIKPKRNWWLFPLEVILVVLPLIVRFYSGNSGYAIYPWNSQTDYYIDIFLHYKMVAFIAISAIILVALVWKVIKMKKEQRKKSFVAFIPLFIYLGFVILSTICSENLTNSLIGAMDQKEPFPVLLGYVIVTFYAYIVINTLDDVKQISGAALVGGFLMSLIGVMQAIGKDPLSMEAVQRLFAGNEVIDNYGMFQLTFPVGQAYGTLFNPNYVGSYVVLYFPLMVAGFLTNKAFWKKSLYAITSFALLFFLFVSQSRTGLIAIAVVVFVFLLSKSKEVFKYWYIIIPTFTFVILSFLLIDTYRDSLLTNRLKKILAIEKSTDALKGIDTTGNGVKVSYKDTEFTVMMAVSSTDFAYVAYEGEEKKEISYNEDKTYGYFTLDNGDEIAIQTAIFEDVYAFGLNLDNKDYYFTNQIVVGNYKYINDYGRVDECIRVDNVLQGYEAVASGRGYSFGRSIPLLFDYFVVGSGPDTFAITFPQNDYVARYKSSFGNTIFTRPHNFYLQMGIQTGGMSLVAFLVFYAIYFGGSCKRYFFRKFTKTEEWFGFAMFLATIGFMAVGFANDSLIVVSPMFYVLLGVGVAINHKICLTEKKKKVEEKDGLE